MLRLKQVVVVALILAGGLDTYSVAQPSGRPPGPASRSPGGTRSTTGSRAVESPAPARDRGVTASTPTPAQSRTEDSHGPGSLQGASSLSLTNFARYKLVTDRNIFNSGRRAQRREGAEPERPKRTETLTLVGVMQYEKGAYAFFDGSSSEYRATLEAGKTIAGHKITAVEPDSVKLQSGTNTVELRMGMQLRREDDGEWAVVAGSGRPSLPTAATPAASESASSDDDEIVKRLMKQREEEMK